jgi:type I restriction enzyme S subunit
MVIDKSAWIKVKLGDFVSHSNESIDPSDGEVSRYVAGEHMDTDAIRIKRWGVVGDGYLGPAFIRRFHPGQVLYGSRRTYLRKLAVADFDGVCANTTLVLETSKPTELLQEFLPFILTTETFHAYSIRESKGSVNPYVNWSDLAKYEFLLPPTPQQAEISKLFWALEAHIASISQLATDFAKTLDSYMNQTVWSSSIERIELRNLTSGVTFLDGDWIESDDMDAEGDIRLLQLSDIGVGVFKDNSLKWINDSVAKRINVNYLKSNDILISRMADPIGRSCLLPALPTKSITVVDVAVLRIEPEFREIQQLVMVLNSKRWTREVLRLSRGTTRTRVTRKDLEKIRIPNIFTKENDHIPKMLSLFAVGENSIVKETQALIKLKFSLLAEILG